MLFRVKARFNGSTRSQKRVIDDTNSPEIGNDFKKKVNHYLGTHDKEAGGYPVFWLRSATEDNRNSAIYINYLENTGKYAVDIQKMFVGYHLPVHLVKSKFHLRHER